MPEAQAKALELGLINRVAPTDKLIEEAEKLTSSLAQGPTLAFEKAKRLVHQSLDNSLQEQFDVERAAIIKSFVSQDFMIGAMAFISKQKPKFEGK